MGAQLSRRTWASRTNSIHWLSGQILPGKAPNRTVGIRSNELMIAISTTRPPRQAFEAFLINNNCEGDDDDDDDDD